MKSDQIGECILELRDVATCLKDTANALEELAELVMPNLPNGPRELYDVAEAEIFKRIRTCMHRIQEVANDIEKASEQSEQDTSTECIVLTVQQGFKLAKALGITADELADAIDRANGEVAQS